MRERWNKAQSLWLRLLNSLRNRSSGGRAIFVPFLPPPTTFNVFYNELRQYELLTIHRVGVMMLLGLLKIRIYKHCIIYFTAHQRPPLIKALWAWRYVTNVFTCSIVVCSTWVFSSGSIASRGELFSYPVSYSGTISRYIQSLQLCLTRLCHVPEVQ